MLEKSENQGQTTINSTHTAQYRYDPAGNRLEDVESGNTTQLAYATGNRLTQRGEVKITLDGRGNLIEETAIDAGTGKTTKSQRRFEYNTQNRPISFYKDGQLSARYHYNANGLRDPKTLFDADVIRLYLSLWY